MKSYRLISILLNPMVEPILRSPFRFLLPKRLVVMTYTGNRTHKKRSVIFHMAKYRDEFVVVPGCFAFLPNWWRNFRKESKVDLLQEGKSMKCFARVIEGDVTVAVPRLAEYVRDSNAARIGITPETTEEEFNKLVTKGCQDLSNRGHKAGSKAMRSLPWKVKEEKPIGESNSTWAEGYVPGSGLCGRHLWACLHTDSGGVCGADRVACSRLGHEYWSDARRNTTRLRNRFMACLQADSI
jgi:hypothetical protein